MNVSHAPVSRALVDVHPIGRNQFMALAKELDAAFRAKLTRTEFRPFEGFRTPERQNTLLARGTTRAAGWQSSHQYGLALDFVDWDQGWKWNDQADWHFLAQTAKKHGLSVPYAWDRPHVEHPFFREKLWPILKAEMERLPKWGA
jgi:hypothetical protein